MKTIEQNLNIIETCRSLKYENSREYEPAEEGDGKNSDNCAYKIYTLIKAELEKNKSEDWQSMLAALERHLTKEENNENDKR
ncbi:MAG: hypothetical protein DDT18_00889 [Actinobacteria bacterium]|nr:hypothetical protein [Actinomycetota bacterium]